MGRALAGGEASALGASAGKPQRAADALHAEGEAGGHDGGQELAAVMSAEVRAGDGRGGEAQPGMIPDGPAPVFRKALLERLDADHPAASTPDVIRSLGVRDAL
jgi:hypothetical protein